MQATLLAFVAACLLLAPTADAQCSGEPAWQSGTPKNTIVSIDGTADYVGMSWPESLTKLHTRCPITDGGGGFTMSNARTLLMCAINVAAFNNKIRVLTERLANVPTMTGFDYDEATKECHLYYTHFAVISAKVLAASDDSLSQWRPYVRAALQTKTTCYSFSQDSPCPTRSDMHIMFCPTTSTAVFNTREEMGPDGAYCCFEHCPGGVETAILPKWFPHGASGLAPPKSAVGTPSPVATMSPNVPRACLCPPSTSLEAAGETGFYCARVSTGQCEDMLYFASSVAQKQATLSCKDGWVECHEASSPSSPAGTPQPQEPQPQNLGTMYDCVSYGAPASATATVLCIGGEVEGGHHCVVPDAELNCPEGTRVRRAPKILSLAADKLSTHGVKSVADAVTSAVAAMVEVTGLSGDSFSVCGWSYFFSCSVGTGEARKSQTRE